MLEEDVGLPCAICRAVLDHTRIFQRVIPDVYFGNGAQLHSLEERASISLSCVAIAFTSLYKALLSSKEKV